MSPLTEPFTVQQLIDYIGQAEVVAVNSSRNLATTDARKVLEVSAAATLTIPLGFAWADGEWCEILRTGTGAVTIGVAGGVTLESAGASAMVTGARSLRVQMSSAIIRKRGTNLFFTTGDFS